jgi:hypothetical protein
MNISSNPTSSLSNLVDDASPMTKAKDPETHFSSDALITGSELENGGTSLDNYMKEANLISPLKVAYDDDGMQFLPSIAHTTSIAYDDDFDEDNFDMRTLQINNEYTISDYLKLPKNEKKKSSKHKKASSPAAPSAPPSSSVVSARNNPPPKRSSNLKSQSPPVVRHSIKDDPNGEKMKMHQHKLRLAAAVGSINHDNRLSIATMEKQLAMAFKKIDNYSKLNQILVRKLDASTVDVEFGRFKTALNEQDEIITKLIEEKRALQRVVRDQGKLLEVSEKVAGPEGIIISSEGQIKVLKEKLRNLHLQLSEIRQKDQEKMEEIETLKSLKC